MNALSSWDSLPVCSLNRGFQVSHVTLAQRVVNKATFSDPSSVAGTYYQTFSYNTAWINLQGRGFSTFGGCEQFDSRTGLYLDTGHNFVFPYTGFLTGYDLAQKPEPPYPNQM